MAAKTITELLQQQAPDVDNIAAAFSYRAKESADTEVDKLARESQPVEAKPLNIPDQQEVPTKVVPSKILAEPPKHTEIQVQQIGTIDGSNILRPGRIDELQPPTADFDIGLTPLSLNNKPQREIERREMERLLGPVGEE